MSKLITPPFTGSYVNLEKARAIGDGPEKFSIQIVLPKDDPFWKKVENEANKIAKEKWNKKPAGLRLPINDGDATDRDEVQGCNYMTVACDADRRPEVVDVNRQAIIEGGELYSGAVYVVSLRPYAWDNKYGKGVSFGLSNAMKVAEGTPFDGRTSADTDFEDMDLSDFLEDEESADVL